jgi:hypothetical protein
MALEQLFTVKFTETGLEIFKADSNSKRATEQEPVEADIKPPRWAIWYEKRLARVWYATLLGMNIEPTSLARSALKKFQPERYQTYLDRLDVAKTLLGYDLPFYEDHMREGNAVGEKYVALADYYEFAQKNGWKELDPMREGLKIDTKPQRPELRQNLKNNLLILLNEALSTQVPGYNVDEPNKCAAAIKEWLKTNELRQPVDVRSLSKYIAEMKDALDAFAGRRSSEAGTAGSDEMQD